MFYSYNDAEVLSCFIEVFSKHKDAKSSRYFVRTKLRKKLDISSNIMNFRIARYYRFTIRYYHCVKIDFNLVKRLK